MKKILLVMLVLSSNSLYGRINESILLMKPMARYELSISMQEVANAYESNQRPQKAGEYNKAALEIYPVGDQAHRLANKLGVSLDDVQTFTNFIETGDQAYDSKKYKKALSNYLMAYELENPMFLYQKLVQTYEALNDSVNASYYRELMEGMKTTKMMKGDDVVSDQTLDGIDPAVETVGSSEETIESEAENADPLFSEEANNIN